MLLVRPHLPVLRCLSRVLSLAILGFAAVFFVAPGRTAADSNEILPLDQVRPGMQAYAYTIFADDQVEKVDLEVISIMPNFLGHTQSTTPVQPTHPKAEHTD